MVKGTLKISIGKKVTEQSFMEHCLNVTSSGYGVDLIFSIYALANSWHINKVLYYAGLIDDVKEVKGE